MESNRPPQKISILVNFLSIAYQTYKITKTDLKSQDSQTITFGNLNVQDTQKQLCEYFKKNFKLKTVPKFTDLKTGVNKANFTKINEKLKELIIQSGATSHAQDVVTFNFIHFCGHGVTENSQPYFVFPFDATFPEYKYIDISLLAKQFAEINNCFTIILFDCCRVKSKVPIDPTKKEDILSEFNGKAIVLCASIDNIPAVNSSDQEYGTAGFLRLLDQVKDKNPMITWNKFAKKYYPDSNKISITTKKEIDLPQIPIFERLFTPTQGYAPQQTLFTQETIHETISHSQKIVMTVGETPQQPALEVKEHKDLMASQREQKEIYFQIDKTVNPVKNTKYHEHELWYCKGNADHPWTCQGKYLEKGCFLNNDSENPGELSHFECFDHQLCEYSMCQKCAKFYIENKAVYLLPSLEREIPEDIYVIQSSFGKFFYKSFNGEKWGSKPIHKVQGFDQLFPKIIPISQQLAYVLGGQKGENFWGPYDKPANAVFELNTKNNTMEKICDWKKYRNHAAMAYSCDLGFIIIVGGQVPATKKNYLNDNIWSDQVELFDINKKEFIEINPLSSLLFGPSLICVNDRQTNEPILYLIGQDMKTFDTIFLKGFFNRSNPHEIVWSEQTYLGLFRGFSGLCYNFDKNQNKESLFIVGGINNEDTKNEKEIKIVQQIARYDIETGDLEQGWLCNNEAKEKLSDVDIAGLEGDELDAKLDTIKIGDYFYDNQHIIKDNNVIFVGSKFAYAINMSPDQQNEFGLEEWGINIGDGLMNKYIKSQKQFMP